MSIMPLFLFGYAKRQPSSFGEPLFFQSEPRRGSFERKGAFFDPKVY